MIDQHGERSPNPASSAHWSELGDLVRELETDIDRGLSERVLTARSVGIQRSAPARLPPSSKGLLSVAAYFAIAAALL